MPSLAMLLAAILWSSAIVGAKVAVVQFAVGEVVVGRFVFAAAFLWAVLLLRRAAVSPARAGIRPLIMGCLDPGLVSLFMVSGLFYTSAVSIAVFWALMPLIMPLLGRIVLGERVAPVVVVGALIAVSGSIWLVTLNSESGEGSLFGDFLGLCGIACAAANSLIARRVAQASANPMATTTYQMTSAILLGLLALFLLPDAGGRETGAFADATPQGVLLLIYLGVFATAGPFFLLNFALQHLPVARTSLFSSLIGPLSMPLAALFVGEAIGFFEIGAVGIVLFGVLLPQATDTLARQPRPNASSDG